MRPVSMFSCLRSDWWRRIQDGAAFVRKMVGDLTPSAAFPRPSRTRVQFRSRSSAPGRLQWCTWQRAGAGRLHFAPKLDLHITHIAAWLQSARTRVQRLLGALRCTQSADPILESLRFSKCSLRLPGRNSCGGLRPCPSGAAARQLFRGGESSFASPLTWLRVGNGRETRQVAGADQWFAKSLLGPGL